MLGFGVLRDAASNAGAHLFLEGFFPLFEINRLLAVHSTVKRLEKVADGGWIGFRLALDNFFRHLGQRRIGRQRQLPA